MKRTVTLGDLLDPRYSVSGCSVCHGSCEQWWGVERKILFFVKNSLSILNLLCAVETQVYTGIVHLFWVLASVFSLVSVFPFIFLWVIVSSLCPPESCSNTLYATYPALVPSRMHTFESEGVVLCRYCYKD